MPDRSTGSLDAREAEGQTKPRRRFRARFTVRAMMLVVLVIAGGLGWVVHRARVQRDAMAAILPSQGSIRNDWEWQNDKYIPVALQKPPGPKWLVDRLGIEYFSNIVAVKMYEHGSDALLAPIGRLDRLESLSVQGKQYTDRGLAYLEGLSHLRILTLFDTQVGDAGLAHLKRLTHLQILDLGFCKVGDTGLAHLKRLTSLKRLSLARTRVTDAGLIHLRGLARLEHLDLWDTHVGNAGLAHLRGLTHLEVLHLGETEVGDTGMAQLERLSNL